MKKPQIKWMLLPLLVAGITLGSCEKEDAGDEISADAEVFTTASLEQADESDWITEEIAFLGDEIMGQDEISASGKGIADSGYFPECVTITTVVTDTSVEKTIDFGMGCELPNGNVLTGMILMTLSKDAEAATRTGTLELAGFTFNGIAVAGEASLFRQRMNENGVPQSDFEAAFSAEWPDGATASWTGNRTREWIEGFGSGFWADNVFLITGSRTFINRQGHTFERTVLESLRREWSCRFIVSGLLQLSRDGQQAELNFGDGSCDGFGTLTLPNGTEEEIRLRRARR
ncbi:hypothetical protein SAMN04490243_0438 [Robiginitalea myxolifaciens]|uniref:Lipoprotein n=1 Tax=Robiginitalea myxolifaciens TaxID=400055 RepID=A0A1I6FQM5_9FLAO|nr:hypothetical protein [Robiginitalea myxolifaciens]SFR32174.1 hypothetical protein SAMN04490243_0438 [Robiginitalea myxolifaciens]